MNFQRETDDFLQTRLLAKLKENLLRNFLPDILKIHQEETSDRHAEDDAEDKTDNNQKSVANCVIIVIV